MGAWAREEGNETKRLKAAGLTKGLYIQNWKGDARGALAQGTAALTTTGVSGKKTGR